ncbi:MAG: hypothetical protein M3N13_10520 [Candidatus Eremiobacteraeota bacterium]|nr:hypothetical protein [Candidatus Eremiobacteraeota bacterium]
MRKYLFSSAAALAAVLTFGFPQIAMAAHVFYGITVHVSTNSIKVHDPKANKTLSFEILPKFDQVFSDDGKTTYQMNHVKAGQYVGIIYDQKFLGMRHADKIYLLNNANERIGKQ